MHLLMLHFVAACTLQVYACCHITSDIMPVGNPVIPSCWQLDTGPPAATHTTHADGALAAAPGTTPTSLLGLSTTKFALAGCDFACPNSLSCTYDFVGIYTVHICTSCMIHVNLVYIVWTVVLTTCLLVSTDVMAAASPSYAMPSVAATQNVSPSLLTSPGVNTSMSGGKLSSPGYGTPIQPPVTCPGIEV